MKRRVTTTILIVTVTVSLSLMLANFTVGEDDNCECGSYRAAVFSAKHWPNSAAAR